MNITDEIIREAFNIPDGESITVWHPLGIQNCPLDFSREGQGIANCLFGLGNGGKLPKELQPWMKGRCEDDTWKEKWQTIMNQCKQCQGKPNFTPTRQVYEFLLKEVSTNER